MIRQLPSPRSILAAAAIAIVVTTAGPAEAGPGRRRSIRAVTALFDAINAKDLDGVMATLAPDIVYKNTGLPTFRGQVAVRAFLEPVFVVLSDVEFAPIDLVARHDVVMVRRIDTVDVPPLFGLPARHLEIPVMGYFRVDAHGKITLWADYFDTATWDTGTGLTLPKQFPPDNAD